MSLSLHPVTLTLADTQVYNGYPLTPARSPASDRPSFTTTPQSPPSAGVKKTIEKVQEIFSKGIQNFDEGIATTFVVGLIDVQSKLPQGFKQRVEASQVFPFPVDVQKRSFHVFVKPNQFNEGTYKKQYRVYTFYTERQTIDGEICSPSRPKPQALIVAKKSNTSYSPLAKQLAEAATPGKIAGVRSHARDLEGGKSICTMRLYAGSLNQLDLKKCAHPLYSIVNACIGVMAGLASLHRHNEIIRDMKADNCLFNYGGDTVTAVLNDYDFLAKVRRTPHKTIGTPLFLDPTMFGSPEETLENQKLRIGLQDPSGDVCAFGKMLELELIPKLLRHKGIQVQKPYKTLRGPFTEEQLQQIGTTYPNQVQYLAAGYGKPYERVIAWKPLSERRNALLTHAHLFPEGPERDAYFDLVNHALEMQGDRDKRQSASFYENLFKDLLPSESSQELPTAKRHRATADQPK